MPFYKKNNNTLAISINITFISIIKKSLINTIEVLSIITNSTLKRIIISTKS